jgi:hypothetical protein
VWGSGCIDPHFLDLGTSWRWVIGFTPRPLNPRGNSSWYTFDRRLVDPRASLDDVEKRKFLNLPGLELRPLSRPACSQPLYRLWDAIPTPLSTPRSLNFISSFQVFQTTFLIKNVILNFGRTEKENTASRNLLHYQFTCHIFWNLSLRTLNKNYWK